jgi:hypothetical protein
MIHMSAVPSDQDRCNDQNLSGKCDEARRGRFHDAHSQFLFYSEAIPLPKVI